MNFLRYKKLSIVKKIVFAIYMVCMVLGCHKKEIVIKPSALLSDYFEKSQNTTNSHTKRVAFNEKALELILQSENQYDSLFFKNAFKIAEIFYSLEEMEAYKTIAKRIATHAEQVQDKSNLAKAWEHIGNYYYDLHMKDSAYCYYLKAEKYYVGIQDKGNTGKMRLIKAFIQYYDGDFSRSEISCLRALKSFSDLEPQNQNQKDIYDAYTLLGVLANDRQEYYKAIEYYTKALQSSTKANSIVDGVLLKAMSLNSLGVVYRNKNENKQALLYFAKALENTSLYDKMPSLYAMLLDNIAYSRIKLNDYSQVPDLFYKALRIRESLQSISGIVINKLHLSEYYQGQKDSKKMLECAKEAYTLAKTKGTDPRDVMLSLQQLQSVDASSKEVYAIEYNRIADSLQQIKPELHDRIVKELAQDEAQELAQVKKKEQLQTILLWLVIVLLISILLGINWSQKSKNKKREARQKKELEWQEAQAQAVIEDKQAYIKVYDLILSQQHKENKKLGTKRMSFIKNCYESIMSQILELRLFLETLTGKGTLYSDGLKKIEEEVKSLYNFWNDMILQDQKEKRRQFVQLLHKLIKQQRKHTTVTDYMDVTWEGLDTVFKIQVYRIIEDCFEVINRTRDISLVELELFEEEDKGVVVLNLDCNGILEASNMEAIASHIHTIGGKLKVSYEVVGTTKIEVALAIKLPEPIISLGIHDTF